MTEQTDAQKLLAERRDVYGDRVTNMERTATLWSALLGVKIEDWQVPLMFSAYKMLRTFETPNYSDNSDDIDGWKEMFVEVMDANHGGIIKARTVEEYKAKLAERELPDPEDFHHDMIVAAGLVPHQFERVDPTHIPLQAQAEGEAIDAFQHRQTEEVAKKLDHQNPYRNIECGPFGLDFHLELIEGREKSGWVIVDDTDPGGRRPANNYEIALWTALLEAHGESAAS